MEKLAFLGKKYMHFFSFTGTKKGKLPKKDYLKMQIRVKKAVLGIRMS